MGAKIIVSSFVGTNSGMIADCRAQYISKKSKMPVSFSGCNKGTINRSFHVTEFEKVEQENYKLPEELAFTQIETKEQFLDIVTKINTGTDEERNVKIKLVRDIDLEGKKMPSIGETSEHAFCGIFDGNGFTVRNFKIQNSKETYVGFFGYVKDAKIVNLAIEGKISGKTHVGGFAGKCENGFIQACSANVRLEGKGELAGFVAENTGNIEKCIVKMQKKHNLFIPILSGAITTAACVTVVATLMLNGKKGGDEYMPPIPVDQEATRYDFAEPVVGKNSIDCEFATKIKVNQKKNKIKMNFKNPGESNQHMVIQLQVTDQELIEKMGSNGRTEEEQKKFDEEGYDAKIKRIVLAESGSIPPGYELKALDLHTLPNGKKIKKGKYKAIVVLSFYDIETNTKAMINTQTPVKLIVE